jgi:RND family efflux transporter MFP subunit
MSTLLLKIRLFDTHLQRSRNALFTKPKASNIVALAILVMGSALSYAQDAINVDVIFPSETQTNSTFVLTGTVEAKQYAQIAALEAGRVERIDVEIGDTVQAGQTLLTLDSKLAQLEVEGAKANLNAAKVNLAEAKRLYQEVLKLSEQQVVAQTLIAERAALLANAEAQLASTQANLSLREELLNRHTLKAPFSGVIAQRNVDTGEWVTQQSTVFDLVAQDDLRLNIAIPQEYYSLLLQQPDAAVSVKPDVSGALPFNAKLSRFVPVSNSATRTFMAQVDLPKDSNLVVGMSARAELTIPNTQRSSITLPRSAVKQHPDGGSSVFIVEDGKAKRVITPVTITANNMVTINNQPFDKAYIISAVELLRDGTPVIANNVGSAQP